MLDVAALLVLQGPGFGRHLDRLSFPSDGCKAFTVLAPGSCSKQSPRSLYPPSLPVMTEPMGAGLTCLQIALARPGRLTPKDAAGWWGLPAEIFCATVSATPTVELVACREQLCSRFSQGPVQPQLVSRCRKGHSFVKLLPVADKKRGFWLQPGRIQVASSPKESGEAGRWEGPLLLS